MTDEQKKKLCPWLKSIESPACIVCGDKNVRYMTHCKRDPIKMFPDGAFERVDEKHLSMSMFFCEKHGLALSVIDDDGKSYDPYNLDIRSPLDDKM